MLSDSHQFNDAIQHQDSSFGSWKSHKPSLFFPAAHLGSCIWRWLYAEFYV